MYYCGPILPCTNVVLLKNAVRSSSRTSKEKVGPCGCFWEGDHVPNRFRIAEYCHEAVETYQIYSINKDVKVTAPQHTQSYASMRRRPALQGVQQVIEGGLLFFIKLTRKSVSRKERQVRAGTPNLEDLREYVFLHVWVMHSHGAASDFCSIQHKVVVLPTHLIQSHYPEINRIKS